MKDLIVILVVLLILGLAALYIWKARKRGVKCIGCPSSATCSGKCAGCSGNCCGKAEKEQN
jgi:hypothetical protein